uniref:hypothetical protein n=1 Tax=Acetatifactor sp. TaxID=1872090 RepID=UPI004056E100
MSNTESKSNLEKHLYQLRRIEEHRDKACEKEIRKIYKKLLKELQNYLGEIYVNYSQDDKLTYGDLARVSMDARFLEEVEQRINGISPEVAKEIQNTVEQTYEACYTGMVNAVTKAAGNREQLIRAFATVSAVTPDVIRRVVNNPVSGLTLKDTLEKYRKDIIYDIKRNIGIGLSNGDRFTTMAERISRSLDGDYKKAIKIARTEVHRVRESGLCDAATNINDALKNGQSGYVMTKTWKTMQDECVRPNRVKKTKKGWKYSKGGKYDHVQMDGVTIPQDELFELPSGATCMCPGQTGVAGEDINCRCYLSYDLKKVSELSSQAAKSIVDKEANANYNRVRSAEEMQSVAQDIKNNIFNYAENESKWSGNIVVDNSLKLNGINGRKEWNCNITLIDTADDGVIWHEMLHSCSVSHYDKATYIMHGNIEEASVEFLKQQICKEKGIFAIDGYNNQVTILKAINKSFRYGTDMEFAKELFNVPLPERYQWLENKVDNSLRKLNASFEDYNEVMGFVKRLKGGD